MRLLATVLLLISVTDPVFATEAETLPGLPEAPIVLAADVDGSGVVATFQLNTTRATDRWAVRSSVPWLQVAPRSGRGPQQITIAVDRSGMSPGQYQARLSLDSLAMRDAIRTLPVNFLLHAARGVTVSRGDNQHLIIGQASRVPFEAEVRDAGGKAIAGVPVVFETMVGASRPARSVVVTDADGRARFQPVPLQYGALEISAHTTIADDDPAHFRAVVSGWVSEFAGDGLQAYGGDEGPAVEAHMNAPFGMMLRDNDLLVVDYFNHSLRRIDLRAGTIHALAGNGKQGFSGDGGPAIGAVMSGPFGATLNPRNDIVIGDYYNNRLRTIDRDTATITTVAGNGEAGYSGDGGEAMDARIDVPLDLVSDSQGNIYFSDWHNHVVRRFTPSNGKIETIAGIGKRAFTGAGPARYAGLSVPLGLSMDQDDNLYIADYGNHMVRRIDARTGVISTVAGSGQQGYSGDGEQAVFARLNRPYNVYVDDNGGLFISDAGNHRVRHVDLASGVITTVAGTGSFGYSPAPELASKTEFQGPFSVIRDAHNNLYVAEYFGHRIRRISGSRPEALVQEPEVARLMRQARSVFGSLPEEAVADDNPVTAEKIRLGKMLFHDPRLSRDASVSCSSCHALDDYGIDGLPLARGIEDRIGTRNSPSVFNAALQDSQFWDGRVENVELQARDPLLHPAEMGMPDEAAVVAAVAAVPEYHDLFASAFPDDADPVTFTNLSLALGAFQRRLMTPGAAIDRFIAGDQDALSRRQLKGLAVFMREGCASCHAGPLFGGQDIHLIQNYPDTRAGDRFEFRKRLGNTHKFKVSPLRNIARTAPYLHDGRYRTLRDSLGERRIAYMIREAGIRDTVDLAAGELDDLVMFMEALTGQIDREYIAIEN